MPIQGSVHQQALIHAIKLWTAVRTLTDQSATQTLAGVSALGSDRWATALVNRGGVREGQAGVSCMLKLIAAKMNMPMELTAVTRHDEARHSVQPNAALRRIKSSRACKPVSLSSGLKVRYTADLEA